MDPNGTKQLGLVQDIWDDLTVNLNYPEKNELLKISELISVLMLTLTSDYFSLF